MTSAKEHAMALRARANACRDIAVQTSDRKMHAILLRLADACEEAAAQIEREADPREPER
jgi:hypothetical protein